MLSQLSFLLPTHTDLSRLRVTWLLRDNNLIGAQIVSGCHNVNELGQCTKQKAAKLLVNLCEHTPNPNSGTDLLSATYLTQTRKTFAHDTPEEADYADACGRPRDRVCTPQTHR